MTYVSQWGAVTAVMICVPNVAGFTLLFKFSCKSVYQSICTTFFIFRGHVNDHVSYIGTFRLFVPRVLTRESFIQYRGAAPWNSLSHAGCC